MKIKGIGHDDTVYALESMSMAARTKRRMLKIGTRGRVLAVRKLEIDDCRKALVKFEGHGWPRAVRVDQISKEKPDGR